MIAEYGAVALPSCSANWPPKRPPRARPSTRPPGSTLGDPLDVGQIGQDRRGRPGDGEGALEPHGAILPHAADVRSGPGREDDLAAHDRLGPVGRAVDEVAHLGGALAPAARARSAATMSGSVESGRPTPTRTRAKSGDPSPAAATSARCGRPARRRGATRMSPNGRSISSWTTSTRSRSSLSAPRAGPALRPASFMKVCGQSTATRGPPGPVRPSVSRPANFFLRLRELPAARELVGDLEADVVRRRA